MMTSDPAEPVRAEPDRPIAIEAAAAVLVVSGIFGFVAIVLAASAPGTVQVSAGALAADVVLDVIAIIVGLLVRSGRTWIFAVNVVAVLAFLELLNAGGVVSVPFAVLYGMAFAAIFLNKPWFDAVREWRAIRPERRP